MSGAAIWLRRDALASVGGWDDGYFMYVEDVDLCWRLGRAGWRVAYEPAGEVTHVQGASTARHPYRMIVEHHRSLLRFAAKRWHGWRRVLLVPAAGYLGRPSGPRHGVLRAVCRDPGSRRRRPGNLARAMANSRSKYTRARIRARSRRRSSGAAAGRGSTGRSRSSSWRSCVIMVVTLSDRGSADVPPQPGNPTTGAAGDHWHAAFGANVCGEWLSNPQTFETAADNPNVRVGIHTHGDGFIHIHPFTKSEGGDNATLGRFLVLRRMGRLRGLALALGRSRLRPEEDRLVRRRQVPAGLAVRGSEGCREVVASTARTRPGNPSDYKLRNGDVVALAFLPEGRGHRRRAERDPVAARTTAVRRRRSRTRGAPPWGRV